MTHRERTAKQTVLQPSQAAFLPLLLLLLPLTGVKL
jgi:hypothetical protein